MVVIGFGVANPSIEYDMVTFGTSPLFVQVMGIVSFTYTVISEVG
ncbi:hypothetical protein ES708_35129 [subsurface metagenome]